MFDREFEDRVSAWAELRSNLETSIDPFADVIKFWQPAPYVQYNHKIDPYNQSAWPTPWEIILHNKYDDFTRALMIGLTLKYTNRFGTADIQIKSLVDFARKYVYNIVSIDDIWVLNYKENTPVPANSIFDEFRLENLVIIKRPT
jgi:hypothetical protein